MSSPAVRSFKVEVRVRGDPGWYGNGLRFESEKDAATYGVDLMGRWLLVEQARVACSADEPNRAYVDGKLVHV